MRDFTTRLAAVCDRLNREGARYVLVGARALQLWGAIRPTRDIHLLIEPSAGNAARVLRALEAIGLGFASERIAEVVASRAATCLGRTSRVDLLTLAGSVDFLQATREASTFVLEGVLIPTASLNHLIASLRTGHPQDAADIEVLREIQRIEDR